MNNITYLPSVLAQLRALNPSRGLTRREAISIAERQSAVLLDLLAVECEPIPLDILERLPRVRLATEAGLPTAGVSFWDGDNWQLIANADEPRTRQRFSLAHEYKHVIDHPGRFLLYSTERQREDAADHFAGCLLMPKRLVTRAWCAGEQDLAQLADRFVVSPAAMERRLRDLGLSTERRAGRYSCARGLRTDRSFAIAGHHTTATGSTP